MSVITSNTKHHVYVQYGDMYTPEIIEKGYTGKRSIVIPVNRCFDTVVDDHLVTLNSQHGKVFQDMYNLNIYTPETLNNKQLSFHFVNVHSLTQSYGTSRYCYIKCSLCDRMSVSKTFELIVGQHTNEVNQAKCKIYNIGSERLKTGTKFFTPILNPAMKILKKYDYNLPKITNQMSNEYLHLIQHAKSPTENYVLGNSSEYRSSLQGYLTELSKGKSCIGAPIFFFFELGTNHLTDASQLVNLDEIARIAKQYNLNIRVCGAADSITGTDDINRNLGASRSEYICSQLLHRSIDRNRISEVNKG